MTILNCAGFVQDLYVVKQQILVLVIHSILTIQKKPSGSALMFHKKYADKNIRTDVKEGNFQDLKQYCGLAFDRDECNGLTFNDSNSILGWDDDTMAQLKKLAVNGKRIEEVQLVMAAYLFEFSSALCIGGNNVSQSAGFESIAHTYHR